MSRPIRVLILLIGFVAFDAAQPASAADPRYPDWPCAQAKVPEISLAAVWAGPSLDDVAGKWKDNAEISALVARLSARRTPIEDAEAQIAKFLSTAGTNKSEAGKKLFAGVFETLNAQRSSVMAPRQIVSSSLRITNSSHVMFVLRRFSFSDDAYRARGWNVLCVQRGPRQRGLIPTACHSFKNRDSKGDMRRVVSSLHTALLFTPLEFP